MSPPLRLFIRTLPYTCTSCATSRLPAKPPRAVQSRSISDKYLEKTAQAADQWALWARDILDGKRKSMLTVLEERGYVNQIAGPRDDLDRLMIYKRVGAYVGIDPTAASLHVGHLVPLMALFWLYINGCHTVSLLGGATARFGDPAGRLNAREKLSTSRRKANMIAIHMQLKSLWANAERYAAKYDYRWEWAWHRELTNNNVWLNKLPLTEVLRLIGDGTRVGTLLGRDTKRVRKKMESGDGLSLAEFLYPVLQSMDWWKMYHTKGIQVQIGGSDQFGNIRTGIEAIKYINKNHYDPDYRLDNPSFLDTPMGFTVPLLTTKSGEKFGKSAGNAIWLDKEKTSTFDLYQFFLRTPDADVERYLKLFTFMPIDQIQSIMAEHQSEPKKRIAQHQLAFEVLELTHGKELATQAAQQHDLVFKSIPPGAANSAHIPETTPLDISSPHTTQNNAPSPHARLPASLVYNQPLSRVLYYAGLVKSRGEGHRIVANKGAYVGSRPGRSGPMGDHLEFTPVQNWEGGETEKFITDGDMLILRVGKWKVKIIKIVSDEQFKRLGLTAPGWNEVDKEPSRVTSNTLAKSIFLAPSGKLLEPFTVSDEERHALAPTDQEWLAAAEEHFREMWLGPSDENRHALSGRAPAAKSRHSPAAERWLGPSAEKWLSLSAKKRLRTSPTARSKRGDGQEPVAKGPSDL